MPWKREPVSQRLWADLSIEVAEAISPAAKCGADIVEFRACKSTAVETACDEHLAVGQQYRRVTIACGGEAAADCPSLACRIVEFHACETADDAVVTACDEHLAVGQ